MVAYWKCYAKGNVSGGRTIYVETNAQHVVVKYEALTIGEKGQVPPDAYIRLMHRLTADTANKLSKLSLDLTESPTGENERQAGVIQLSSSEWASPIVLELHNDGSLSFFVDYRRLN